MWLQKTNCVGGIGQEDSGTDYFTVALSDLVGPLDYVQAVDLLPQQLRVAKRRCRRVQVPCVTGGRGGGAIEGHAR
jgi:hypothetical protein